jgi:hypothetical protein
MWSSTTGSILGANYIQGEILSHLKTILKE